MSGSISVVWARAVCIYHPVNLLGGLSLLLLLLLDVVSALIDTLALGFGGGGDSGELTGCALCFFPLLLFHTTTFLAIRGGLSLFLGQKVLTGLHLDVLFAWLLFGREGSVGLLLQLRLLALGRVLLLELGQETIPRFGGQLRIFGQLSFDHESLWRETERERERYTSRRGE
jgi:hypothetical protein